MCVRCICHTISACVCVTLAHEHVHDACTTEMSRHDERLLSCAHARRRAIALHHLHTEPQWSHWRHQAACSSLQQVILLLQMLTAADTILALCAVWSWSCLNCRLYWLVLAAAPDVRMECFQQTVTHAELDKQHTHTHRHMRAYRNPLHSM